MEQIVDRAIQLILNPSEEATLVLEAMKEDVRLGKISTGCRKG
jgi:hypothetical protein